MPGLIRGVARTAAVVGTASAVSGRVQRRQQNKFAAQDQQAYEQQQQQAYEQQQQAPPPTYAPPPPPPPEDDMGDKLEQLRQLGELKAQGVLTEEEFYAQKSRILG
jgi:type II secretory pathway pseudopilin PulG